MSGSTRKGLFAAACAGAAAAMLGLAFAAEPLYRTFCQVTGFGGTTRTAADVEGPVDVLDRVVTVRFDANVAPGLPLEFAPDETSRRVNVGEHALAFYRISNTSDRRVRAVASYNVTPHSAGPYFIKLECFCFQEEWFEPGETRELPVVFFVHPAIVEEAQMDHVSAITLSYTYFEARGDDADTGGEAAR